MRKTENKKLENRRENIKKICYGETEEIISGFKQNKQKKRLLQGMHGVIVSP
jgi:hypothetical protein